MATSIGSAILWIKGDTKGLSNSLKQSRAMVMSAAQAMVKSIKIAVAGFAAIGAAAAAVGVVAVRAAGEQLKAEAQLAAVLKSTKEAAGLSADEIKRMAGELQGLTTFGDEAIIRGQALLLTFTGIGKDIFPAATMAMLDMSTALGQDLKSSAVQLGKALNDPILGMTALRRVGVNFSQQQVDMVKAMIASGKTMDAQRFILSELATEFGGSAAAAADTFAGRTEQLKNRMGDLMEEIGYVLIPELEKLWAWAMPKVQQAIKWVSENQEALREGFNETAKDIGRVVIPAYKAIVFEIDVWIKRIEMLIDAYKKLKPIVDKHSSGAMGFVGNVVPGANLVRGANALSQMSAGPPALSGVSVNVSGGLHVRNENDVQRVAQELARLVDRKRRETGGGLSFA